MREAEVCPGAGRVRPVLFSNALMISAQNISKDYGPRRVLHPISFEVASGEVLGFLGPNGAGKTTAMRILTGFFRPTEGRVMLDGIDMAQDPVALKRRIGYLPENLSLYPDLRVEEFLKFVAEIKGIPAKKIKGAIEEKMAQCGLQEVRKRLIGHLSKGYRQRVGLAQALVGDPDVLILDEPTNGLDPQQIIEIRELIRQLGRDRTLILSTHILPEVSRVCERVLILNQGRIVAQGRPEDLERGLVDRQEIVVRVGRKFETGEKADLLEPALREISGVESVEKIPEEDLTTTYLLETFPTEDLRPEISRRIVERGFPLLELTTKRLSLEDIFLKLVLSEEGKGK